MKPNSQQTHPQAIAKRRVRHLARPVCLWLLALPLAGCNLPGRPKPGPEVPRPEQQMNFEALFAENCVGCHGVEGQNGPATNLHNPEYQAWIDDASLRTAIAYGQKGTLMPGFSLKGGGNLTDQQVEVLVRGMRDRWGKQNAFGGATPPPYHPAQPGNAANGGAVYQAACARCHGADRDHPGPSGSVLDGSFLALISEQTVRTTIVPGRPDIGQPDWRGLVPGRALTDTEVSDVSAWLIGQTPSRPGHPYPNLQPNSERPGEQQPIAIKK